MSMNKAECEQRAKGLAASILRASADPLEVQYAVGQLMTLYEMISEGEAEIARLEDELNRQRAKTEYEAERGGNIENDFDLLRTELDRMRTERHADATATVARYRARAKLRADENRQDAARIWNEEADGLEAECAKLWVDATP